MDKGVIIVTVGYRLGPLGFLCMGTDDAPGNAGLKDQAMGLAWVNKNIAAFGGDQNAVTIFGESAGALSVALHLTSPISKDLFQRAIMQSDTGVGSAWKPITSKHAVQYGELLSKALGCDHVDDVLKCMQDQDLSNIFANADVMNGGTVWQAVPDHDFTSEPFMPGDPESLMSNGQFNKDIEVMAGTNTDEGILYLLSPLSDPALWDDYKIIFEIKGPGYLFNIANISEVTELDVANTQEIVEYYVGSIENINEEHKQGMIDMFTDASFLYGVHNGINYLLEYGVKVFEYVLSYEGQYSFAMFWANLDHPIGV